MEGHTEPVTLAVDTARSVSGLWRRRQDARACFVLAHGAGPGMTHPFLEAIADGLADRRVASLRYQFPFMEQGSRRPDQPKLAHATVRGGRASLRLFQDGDHSFYVPARSGRTAAKVREEMLEALAAWIDTALLN